MTKPHPRPSDRGRENPEPGPAPGTRAAQRDTDEQLAAHHDAGQDALEWERAEQERLPPRGEGSQKNQGEARGPSIHDASSPRRDDDTASPPTDLDGLHSGGNRRPGDV